MPRRISATSPGALEATRARYCDAGQVPTSGTAANKPRLHSEPNQFPSSRLNKGPSNSRDHWRTSVTWSTSFSVGGRDSADTAATISSARERRPKNVCVNLTSRRSNRATFCLSPPHWAAPCAHG